MTSRKNTGSRQTKPKFEAILPGVKAGSVSHVSELKASWPKNTGDTTRALEALLSHLSVTAIPNLKKGKAFVDDEDAKQVVLIKTTLDLIETTVLGSLEHASKEHVAQMLNVFDEHLSDLIAALEFRTRHSSSIIQGQNKTRAARLGNVLEANCVHRLIFFGLGHFEAQEGLHSLTALVDCLLRCWVRGASGQDAPQETELSPADYSAIEKVLEALMKCINEDSTRALMVKRVESFDKRRLRMLAESFPYYCLEWRAAHVELYNSRPRDVNCDHLAMVISVSQVFAEEIPAFHRALLETNFPSLALKLGVSLREAPAASGCVGSISTDIASRLVPAAISRAWAVVHVLPKLLDSGLLEMLIEDALTPGQRAFQKWSKQEPLQQICRVAHHPVVFKSLDAAERQVSAALWGRIEEHPIASQRFKVLPPTLDLQDMLEGRMDTVGQAVLCSCLEHDTLGVKSPSKVYKCSNCQTVTYCSRKCQERDWQTLHRVECAQNRVHRMGCELQGIWPSHLNRARRLYALEPALRSAMRTPPPPELAHYPGGRSAMHPIYIANTMQIPMGVGPCTDDFFVLTGNDTNKTALFDDARFRAMVKQAEANTDIQLIGSVAMLGEYWFAALAAFHLRRPSKDYEGKELREMLHGHVRLVASSS